MSIRPHSNFTQNIFYCQKIQTNKIQHADNAGLKFLTNLVDSPFLTLYCYYSVSVSRVTEASFKTAPTLLCFFLFCFFVFCHVLLLNVCHLIRFKAFHLPSQNLGLSLRYARRHVFSNANCTFTLGKTYAKSKLYLYS